MTLFKIGLIFLTLFVIINNGLAQNLQQTSEYFDPSVDTIETVYDNRSIGMGKTAITTANGSSAIFSNPAILGTFSQGHVQFGGKLIAGSIENEFAESNTIFYDSSYPMNLNRSFIALAHPFNYDENVKLTFGIGYQRNEGVKIESESESLIQIYIGPGLPSGKERVKVEQSTKPSGGLNTISPALALNINDEYFIGASINTTLGAMYRTDESSLIFKEPSNDTGIDKIERETKQEALFLKFGFLAKFTPDLTIGLTYRPQFEWDIGKRITKYRENGEYRTERFDIDIELTIPAMWGVGLEYMLSPDWIVAAQIESRPFSDLEFSDFDDETFIDDGFNVSIGAEYLNFRFPVRFGTFQDVVPKTEVNDTEPATLSGITAGVGSGDIGNFTWDASVLFSRWHNTKIDDRYEYSEDLYRVGVSGTYRFSAF